MNIPYDIIVEGVVTVAGIAGLVHYRIHRKFKQEKSKGVIDFADRNMVELILLIVLVPDWKLLLKLFE